jgi:hypothetical protein
MMRRALTSFAMLAGFFAVTVTASAQTASPPVTNEHTVANPYYSPDEYRLAHTMFDRIRNDLYRAQTNAYPNDLGDTPRFDIAHNELRNLEQNWNQGHYDNRQIGDTISAIQMVLQDNRLRPHDRDVLGRDLSRLLDFKGEYY